MFAWILENIATILICAVLLAVVALILTSMIRKRKKGVSSCGCSCSSCPMSAACHEKK